MNFFNKETKTALQAIEYAQWIAHAPMIFQASRVLRDSGILKAIENAGINGLTIGEVVEKVDLSHYAVRVLLESGLGIDLVILKDEKYVLTKTGYFILNDKMTDVNMNFTHDVCYQGLFNLEDSLKSEKPEGLKVFGEWRTIYEGLLELPYQVQKSWFEFDHYYSDNAFPLLLSIVHKNKPARMLDIGGNTGKWAIQYGKFDEAVAITIVDLPGQINVAKTNIEKQALSHRISFCEANILDENQKLPEGYDAIWMSQFLDCFSEKEITKILTKCFKAISDDGFLYIVEPFWNRQRFKAAAFSLQQTSLYFTTMANGNSQIYHADVFIKCVEKAGFKVIEQIDHIGICQSLLMCKKNS